MTHNTSGVLKNSRKTDQLTEHLRRMEQDVENVRISSGGRIGVATQQLALLPHLAEDMTKRNLDEKVDDLYRLGQSIGRDLDHYADKHQAITRKFEAVKAKAPVKKNHLSRYNAACMAIGREYLELDEKVTRSILPSMEQILTIAEVGIDDNPVVKDTE